MRDFNQAYVADGSDPAGWTIFGARPLDSRLLPNRCVTANRREVPKPTSSVSHLQQ
jgi:hypothetical protein